MYVHVHMYISHGNTCPCTYKCMPQNSAVCLGVSEVGTTAARFYHMLSAASATGEYEKVCHGEHHCHCR